MTREGIERTRCDHPEKLKKAVEVARRALAGTMMLPAKLCLVCGGWLIPRSGNGTFEVRHKLGKQVITSGTLVDLPYYFCQGCGQTFVEKTSLGDSWVRQLFSHPEYQCVLHTGFIVVERAYRHGEVPQPITEKQRQRLEEFLAFAT